MAIGQAGSIAITVNLLLTITLFAIRFNEVRKSKKPGAPFVIAAAVNIFTALSIEFNRALGTGGSRLLATGLRHFNTHDLSSAISMMHIHNLLSTDKMVLAANISALAYIAWAVGHLYAGQHEKNNTIPKSPRDNPQLYYGIGDISAVNASGSVNVLSIIIMVLGFIKSTLMGRKTKDTKNIVVIFIKQNLTSPRLYGLSYIVGAATSLAIPHFAIAQVFWALAYFQFT